MARIAEHGINIAISITYSTILDISNFGVYSILSGPQDSVLFAICGIYDGAPSERACIKYGIVEHALPYRRLTYQVQRLSTRFRRSYHSIT